MHEFRRALEGCPHKTKRLRVALQLQPQPHIRMAALASVGRLVFSWDAHSDFWLRGPGKRHGLPARRRCHFPRRLTTPKFRSRPPGQVDVPAGEPTRFGPGAGTSMHRAIRCLHKRTSGARSVSNQGPYTRMHSYWRRKEASRRRHRAYGLLAAVVESEGQLSSVGCQVLSGL